MATHVTPFMRRMQLAVDIKRALTIPHPLPEYLHDLSSTGGLEYLLSNTIQCISFLEQSRAPLRNHIGLQ